MSAGVSLCLVWILYEYSWRSFFTILYNNAREKPSSWEHLLRLFRTPSDRNSHSIHIVRTSCGQLFVRSGIFCLLVVYWLCGLKFVYLAITLAFGGIIVKIKLPAKCCLNSFEGICLHISSDTKYFSLLSKALWLRINNL